MTVMRRITLRSSALRGLHAAIEQLELAKQAGGSFYQLSMIESDLRELREMAGAHRQ
ncbi:MAG: hypothetical protein Q8O58_03280 [Gallionella sp.]|nr:hypothetical protein [Gallionella sp.]